MNNADYLANRMAYIKTLKAPSEQQQLLVLLAEKTDRTRAENKALHTLLKAERAQERAAAAKTQALHLLKTRQDADRKARNHRLIKQGLLIDLAGLENWESGQLLGALLAAKEALETQPAKADTWKARGQALLAEHSAANAKSADTYRQRAAPVVPRS